MNLWKPLKKGDTLAIIAPAAAPAKNEKPIEPIKELLAAWGLTPFFPDNLFGEDLLCANNESERVKSLQAALLDPTIAGIWCLRGGYGSMQLLPQLANFLRPEQHKLFIGMSDITALHLFLQQQWGWSTLHASSAQAVSLKKIAEENITELRNILLGEVNSLEYSLTPLNSLAKTEKKIVSSITGGNLSLIRNSLGTFWQVNAKNKILLFEDINERGYRIDGMLEQLTQAGIFKDVSAVLIGDFSGGKEPDGSSLEDPVLQRFADRADFPVLRCFGVGHGDFNRPLPFGVSGELHLGDSPSLQIKLF